MRETSEDIKQKRLKLFNPNYLIKLAKVQQLKRISNRKRYYLHKVVRKQGFALTTDKRTIYVKPDSELSIQVLKLRELYNYSIQLEMF